MHKRSMLNRTDVDNFRRTTVGLIKRYCEIIVTYEECIVRGHWMSTCNDLNSVFVLQFARRS